MAKELMIEFQGICAFVKRPGGKILVVLPETGGEVKKLVRSIKSHQAYLIWKKADADSRSTLKADKKKSKKGFGVALLKNETLQIAGPVPAGPLTVAQTFVDQVPSMDKLAQSPPQTSARIAAQITIDRGYLEANPSERGHYWVFKRYGDTQVTVSESQSKDQFSNNVLWTLDVNPTASAPVRIVTSQGDLVLKPKAAVQITIGNLENPLPAKTSTRRKQDVDFLFQYEVASNPLPADQRLIPTRSSSYKTRGARVECFAASWGDIQAGVQ